MKTRKEKNTLTFISDFLDQPQVMPEKVREAITSAWQGECIQIYAMADLDAQMRLGQSWIALGEKYVAVVKMADQAFEIQSFARDRVRKVRETAGLSCHSLILLGEPDQPPLALLYYSNRQRRAIGNIQFILEQSLEGYPVSVEDADKAYEQATWEPVRDAQASLSGNRHSVVWRLLGYLVPYRWQVGSGMVAAILMTAASLVPALLAGYLIDSVVRPYQSGTLAQSEARATAVGILIAIAVAYLLREFFAFVRLRTMAMAGECVATDLRNDLYSHIQRLSLGFFSKKQTGSIISRVSSDTDRIWDFIAFGVVEVTVSVVMLMGLGTVLIYLDWRLGLVMTVPVPFMLYAIYRHGQKMHTLFLRVWRKWSNMTDILSDTIPGIRVVKAFHQEGYEKKRFRNRNQAFLDECQGIHRSWTSFWPALMISVQAVILVVWALALPRLLSDGSTTALTAGTFVSFLLYMTMFAQPIEIIGQMARMLNRATSSAYRIFEVLDTEPKMVDASNAKRLEPVRGHIRFENVCFAYDGVRQVLKSVNFDIQPGEMIGLVGPSGGGKTTIMNLIARFHEASAGQVCVDGVDIKTIDTGHYRRQVGMVLQDPYLFHGTVLENIRYGLPNASLDQVVAAAEAANAHGFIGRLPHGYDTVVGEKGHTLSGGERQRVSIARAILHDPKILLLDEATSSVDTDTERKIQEALDRLVAGRTVIAIAHRLSTLTQANRIFVVEDGRITEQGTHQELLAKPEGTYSRLSRLQREVQSAFAM